MKHVLRHEGGALGLFRGLLPTLAREVPGNAAYFGVYEWLKRKFAAAQVRALARVRTVHTWPTSRRALQGVAASELGSLPLMVAGGAGGAAFWVAVYPVDSIKSRLQVDNVFAPKYRGALDCFRQVVATAGWRALFRGFGPCFARSIPANSVAFLTFEGVRKALSTD